MGDLLVVGLDVSLTGTGIADSDGRCTTIGRKGVTRLPLHLRWQALSALGHEIWRWTGIRARGRPALVVFEGLEALAGSKASAVNERAFLWWWLMGAAVETCGQVVSIAPRKLKVIATGSGVAEKGDVVAAAVRWDKWPDLGRDGNRADAAALCVAGAILAKNPIVALQGRQLQALDGVEILRGGELQ